MKLFRNTIALVVLCAVVPVYTKDKKKAVVKKEVTSKKVTTKNVKKQAPVAKNRSKVSVEQQPVVSAQPAAPKKKLSMDVYLTNQVAALQGNLVNDIFPKKDTIERIVLEFKNEYPGPNKESDTNFIYNALINNAAIKNMITLDNAVHVYKFLRETINEVWTTQDELIWARS